MFCINSRGYKIDWDEEESPIDSEIIVWRD